MNEHSIGISIRTERLELREFRDQDFAAVQRFASDPVVTRYTSFGPNTEAQTREFLERARQHANANPRTDFELAVIERKSGDLVGDCGLLGRRVEFREYEIGFVLARDYWSRRFASEIVPALVNFGFSTLRAHRLFATVDPANEASARVLSRAGFRLEGHLRQDTFARGGWHDSLVYALLEEEFTPPPAR